MAERRLQDTIGSAAALWSLKTLSSLTARQLSMLYATSEPIEIPDGESHGKAIILPGTIFGKLLSCLANLAWKGKIFNRSQGTLVNKILGLHFVKAEVFMGESWFDKKPAVIIDYKKTSWVASYIRDEIRQLVPGLYLGRAYIRLPRGKHFHALYFALDFRR
jgi:hypothetical protein